MKMLRKIIVIGGVAMASATLPAIAQQGQQQGPTMGQGAVGPGQGGTMPHTSGSGDSLSAVDLG
jgi:Spy/CpxP family protein refolding chaperone